MLCISIFLLCKAALLHWWKGAISVVMLCYVMLCYSNCYFTVRLQGISNESGVRRIEQHGIKVTSPHDPLHNVSLKPLFDASPGLGLSSREVIIAPGLKFSPPCFKFTSPIKVTVPHCASFNNPRRAKLRFYTRNTGKTKEQTCYATNYKSSVSSMALLSYRDKRKQVTIVIFLINQTKYVSVTLTSMQYYDVLSAAWVFQL